MRREDTVSRTLAAVMMVLGSMPLACASSKIIELRESAALAFSSGGPAATLHWLTVFENGAIRYGDAGAEYLILKSRDAERLRSLLAELCEQAVKFGVRSDMAEPTEYMVSSHPREGNGCNTEFAPWTLSSPSDHKVEHKLTPRMIEILKDIDVLVRKDFSPRIQPWLFSSPAEPREP